MSPFLNTYIILSIQMAIPELLVMIHIHDFSNFRCFLVVAWISHIKLHKGMVLDFIWSKSVPPTLPFHLLFSSISSFNLMSNEVTRSLFLISNISNNLSQKNCFLLRSLSIKGIFWVQYKCIEFYRMQRFWK